MGEKIKDLIYDFSDIIISLVIITMIFGVVSWKISDSMAYTQFTGQSSKAVLDKNDTSSTDSENSEDTQVTTTDTSTAAGDTATTPPAGTGTAQTTGGKPSASANAAPTAGTNAPTTSTVAPTTASTPNTVSADVKIVIPAGSAGITIAKILKGQGVITDTKTFITRVDELKMGPKLKAGTFTIKAGSSLDDVINTIAGKK